MLRSKTVATLSLLLVIGCAAEDTSPGDESRGDAVQAAESGLLFSITGLSGPEAVRYDPAQDVYFVSNFNGGGGDRDANGFISRVSATDGSMQEREFMTATGEAPLHAPRGMMIVGDTLWVADIDGVHGFHRVTGEHFAFVDMTTFEPGFLNDIAADDDGRLYVSDTGRSRIYLVEGGAATIAIEGDDVGPPNGVTWDGDAGRVLIAPWAGGGGTVRSWQPDGTTVETIAPTVGDRLDGIELFEGAILVAVQSDSSIYSIRGSEVSRAIQVDGAPADIAVDTQRSRVAVPYIALDRVDVLAIPR